MQPQAPVPRAGESEAPAPAVADTSDDEVNGDGRTRAIKERSQLIKEAAESEVATFISTLVHDHQDAAKLKTALLSHAAVLAPLAPDTRLLLHWDWAKEAEASQTFTKSHNIFERVPGMCRNRAMVVKQTMDLVLGEKPEAGDEISSPCIAQLTQALFLVCPKPGSAPVLRLRQPVEQRGD